MFLSLDHVNGHGDEPRNKYGHHLGGMQLYVKLRRMKYPEGYQVLCFNCNCAKGFYGVCPHRIKGTNKEERKNDGSERPNLFEESKEV